MSRGVSESNNNGLRHFGAADRDALPEMTGRPSYSENRRDALGRMQPSSLRGSEVDSEYIRLNLAIARFTHGSTFTSVEWSSTDRVAGIRLRCRRAIDCRSTAQLAFIAVLSDEEDTTSRGRPIKRFTDKGKT